MQRVRASGAAGRSERAERVEEERSRGSRRRRGRGARMEGYLPGGAPCCCSVAALCEGSPSWVGCAPAGVARAIDPGEVTAATGSQIPLPGSYLRPRDRRPPNGTGLEVRPSC